MARNESYDFNSRTHVECDVTGAFQRPGHQGFQLTHSRGVRLGAMAIDILALGISTHALTWSATIPGYSPARFLYISTHALTWSATEENLITLLIIKISTHALTWSATISSTVIIIPHFISTHALTWSATRGLTKRELCEKNFNSRTHVECDSKYCIKKRFTTQYMGIYCFLSSIILIFFIYSKK